MNHNPVVAMDACHYALIYGFAVATKPRRVLELGIGSGGCTRMLLEAIRFNGIGHLTAVDNWFDWGGQRPEGLPEDPALTILEATESQFIHGGLDQFELIVSDADHFHADRWIDGTLRRLAPGGVAFFHDVCNPMFPNLAKIEHCARQEGYHCRVFATSSRADERCERGLLVVQ